MAEKKLSQFRISNETYDIYDKEAQDCLTNTDLINGNLNLDGDAVINKTLEVMLEKDEPVLSVSEDENEIKGWETEDGVYLISFVQSSQNSSYWEAILPKPLFNDNNYISNYTFKWFDGSQELNNFSTLSSTSEEWSVEINEQSKQMFSTQDAQHNILSFAIDWANDSNYFPNQEPKIEISGLFVKYKHPSQIIAAADNIEIQSNTISASGDTFIDGNIAADSAIIDRNADIGGNATIGGTMNVSGNVTTGGRIDVNNGTVYQYGANKNNYYFVEEGANSLYNQTIPAQVTRVTAMVDSNNQHVSRLSLRQRADGRKCAGLEAHGFTSNDTVNDSVWNALWVVVDKQGNRSYEISDPIAFRNALGWETTSVTNSKNNNNIFKTISKSSFSVPNAGSTAYDYRNLCDPISLTPGYWMVFASVEFGTNSNGIRTILLNDAAAENSPSHIGVLFVDTRTANSGFSTRCKMQGILVVNETTSYYLKGYQNSGSSINASSRIQAFRLV